MEEKEVASVTQAAFEAAQDRWVGLLKWVIAINIILLIALIGSNVAWFIYENQFEDVVTTTVTQEGEGNSNNYIGGDGNITNGETDDQNNQNPRP